MNLELANELIKVIKSRETVYRDFKNALVKIYRSYREGDMCVEEYQMRYNGLVYRFSDLARGV